jgi:hypothetical protein
MRVLFLNAFALTSEVVDSLDYQDYDLVQNRYMLKKESVFAVKTIKSD